MRPPPDYLGLDNLVRVALAYRVRVAAFDFGKHVQTASDAAKNGVIAVKIIYR
jgi:hypothetical protein